MVYPAALDLSLLHREGVEGVHGIQMGDMELNQDKMEEVEEELQHVLDPHNVEVLVPQEEAQFQPIL